MLNNTKTPENQSKIERQTDRQTDGQTDRQRQRQRDRKKQRQTDRETDRDREIECSYASNCLFLSFHGKTTRLGNEV